MALCICQKLGVVSKVAEYQSFFEALIEVEIGNWIRLKRCITCSQLWAVAEWHKYQIQLATKIAITNRSTWQEANIEAEKEYLIKSRGGLTSKKCSHSSCIKPCVAGVAYCVDHLYETGARV
jgi:hypothetical protein